MSHFDTTNRFLSQVFIIFTFPTVFPLECYTGDNFKMFCGDKDIEYTERCHMVPSREFEDSQYITFLPIEKCQILPGNQETDYECFYEIEYPELSEYLVKKVFDVEVDAENDNPYAKEDDDKPVFEEGVLVNGYNAGCRKKAVGLGETDWMFKNKNDEFGDMCFSVLSGLIDNGKTLQNYTLWGIYGTKLYSEL